MNQVQAYFDRVQAGELATGDAVLRIDVGAPLGYRHQLRGEHVLGLGQEHPPEGGDQLVPVARGEHAQRSRVHVGDLDPRNRLAHELRVRREVAAQVGDARGEQRVERRLYLAEILLPQGDRRRVEDAAVARFALAQCLLGGVAFGAVAEVDRDAARAAASG